MELGYIPLTKSMPKALLDVNGRPMVEYILERIEVIPDIEEVYMVVNKNSIKSLKNGTETMNLKSQ